MGNLSKLLCARGEAPAYTCRDRRKGQVTEDFEGFFRAQFNPVARSLGLVIGDREEGIELAQEAFARAWTRWDRYSSAAHARNSIMRIGINLARSEGRRRKRLAQEPPGDRQVLDSDVPTRLAIVDALRTLSERQRICIVLTDYLGMDSREVGRLLRVPAGSVRTHVARGRKRLRSLLDEENQETNR